MRDIIIISIISAYVNYAVRYLDLPYGLMKNVREWWTRRFTNSRGGWEQLVICGWCLAPWVTALTVFAYNFYRPAGSISRMVYWWLAATCLSAFIAHYGERY